MDSKTSQGDSERSYLGPFCQAINLSVKDLDKKTITSIQNGTLSVGVVIELSKYIQKQRLTQSRLIEIVVLLQPNLKMQNTNTLKTRINRILETQKRFEKKTKVPKYKTIQDFHSDLLTLTVNNKSKTTQIDANFPKANDSESDSVMNEPCPKSPIQMSPANETFPSPTSPVKQKSSPIKQKLPAKMKTCQNEDAKKENNLQYRILVKQNTLEKLIKLTESEKQNVERLQSIKGHFSVRNVTKRDECAAKTRKQLRETKHALLKSKNEGELLKSANSELRAELEDLKILHEKIKAENQRLYEEQKKKINAQKLNSYYRTTLKKMREGDEKRNETNNNLTKDYNRDDRDSLMLELETLREGKKSDLKDDRGIFTNDLRLCVIELFGLEIAIEKIPSAIQVVANHIFKCQINDKELPTKSTVQNIVDEGQFLVKSYIADRLHTSESFGISRDGTSRQKKKILDTSITLDNGEIVSLGFKRVVSETAEKINLVTKTHLTELAKCHSDSTPKSEKSNKNESTDFIRESLEKLAFTMSDRAANEKCADKFLNEWRDQELKTCSDEGTKTTVLQFHCMAHVLLGFHRYVCDDLKKEEKTISNEPIGRDQLPYFKNWSKKQTVAERVAYTTSGIFGPAGDHLGLRDKWESFCANKGLRSLIGNYRDNRFNGLFQTSAEILFHLSDFLEVIKNVPCPNNKIKAVEADLQSPIVQTMLSALTAMYVKVTGPYWWLVTSGSVKYLELFPYINSLWVFLDECEKEPITMIEKEWLPNAYVPHVDKYQKCVEERQNELSNRLTSILSGSMKRTVEKQLADFLEGGRYAETPSKSDLQRTQYAHVTNLGCEHHFGDLDSSQRRRPNASFHHHSSVQLIKRNRCQLFKWLDKKHESEKNDLLKAARKGGRNLREIHTAEETSVRRELFESMTQKPKPKRRKVVCTPQPDAPTTTDDQFDFRLGDYVAIAYQDAWYPGCVEKVDKDVATVNFMAPCRMAGVFTWPARKDTQEVNRTFILCCGLVPEARNSGRQWFFKEHCDLEIKYLGFKDQFF